MVGMWSAPKSWRSGGQKRQQPKKAGWVSGLSGRYVSKVEGRKREMSRAVGGCTHAGAKEQVSNIKSTRARVKGSKWLAATLPKGEAPQYGAWGDKVHVTARVG
jgi:hypothetical protein